jgi:hypothetical protein
MMRVRGVIVIAVTGLLWVTASSPARAQTPAPAPSQGGTTQAPPAAAPEVDLGDIELTRASIQVKRQALVTSAMDLEPKEAEAFWPLYREYRMAMATVNDRFVKLLITYLGELDALTDDSAARMTDEYLGIERDRNGVKVTYVPKFKAVMPARKVARFFQIDHKLDAVTIANLAELIPLAR